MAVVAMVVTVVVMAHVATMLDDLDVGLLCDVDGIYCYKQIPVLNHDDGATDVTLQPQRIRTPLKE